MKNILVTTSTILFLAVGIANASNHCAGIFSAPLVTPEIQSSIEKSITALAELKITLDLAQANGTQKIDLTALRADYKNKEKELSAYLVSNKILTSAELLEKIKAKISALQKEDQNTDPREKENEKIRKQHEQALQNLIIDGRRAVLHRVEPGSFKMSNGERPSVGVTLTKPFAMMATPTTQIIWKKVADLAQKNLPYEYHVNPDPSQLKGASHPVETVSHMTVVKWLAALTELSQRGVPELSEFISEHKRGDIYRLPTEAEWEFVARGRGEYNEDFYFENNRAEDYAWIYSNSNLQTQPVATKSPLVVHDKNFYDLLGNVSEWVSDKSVQILTGGENPHETTGNGFVFRGGDYNSTIDSLQLWRRWGGPESYEDSKIGFRFVREAR